MQPELKSQKSSNPSASLMGSVGGHGANILVEELKRREEADMISTPDDQSNALLVSLGSQNRDSGTTTPDEGL